MSAWIAVCRTSDIDRDDVIPARHDGHDYAIYRSPDDRFFATDGHCTHERTLLCDGLVMRGTIECPKHNGRFDYMTGQAKSAPAIVDLRPYPVRVEDDVVYIEVD